MNSITTLTLSAVLPLLCPTSAAARAQDNNAPYANVDQLASEGALVPLNGFQLTISDYER